MRLSALCSFVLALGWAGSAFAEAPMCGMRAQTIAAPPIQIPTTSDELRAVNPCNGGMPLQLTTAPYHDAPQPLQAPELPLRALPSLTRSALAPRGARLSRAAAEQELEASGFARSIDRPPRR